MPLEIVAIVALTYVILGWFALYALLLLDRERGASEERIDRLQRLVVSKNMGEYAATERALSRGAGPDAPPAPRAPSTLDSMWDAPPPTRE